MMRVSSSIDEMRHVCDLPEGNVGMIAQSTTRNRDTPRTRNCESTTLIGFDNGPIAHVPTG
jgi:hypothetical protein